MREIKFRGKIPNTDIWIYGHLVEQLGAKSLKFPRRYIVCYDEKIEDYDWEKPCSVERESVGQFTGAYDCHGVEIYEGDICDVVGSRVYIAWDNYYFKFNFFNPDGSRAIFRFEKDYTMIAKIIGNIFDNLEMLRWAE